jgi:hypothetical protein
MTSKLSSWLLIALITILIAHLSLKVRSLLPSMYASNILKSALRPLSHRVSSSPIVFSAVPRVNVFSSALQSPPINARTMSSDNQSNPPKPQALTAQPFYEAILNRRSIYALNDKSPITNSKITQLVKDTLLHVPSSFNSQATRIVVVVEKEHRKFWEMAMEEHKKATGDDTAKWERAKPRFEVGDIFNHSWDA